MLSNAIASIQPYAVLALAAALALNIAATATGTNTASLIANNAAITAQYHTEGLLTTAAATATARLAVTDTAAKLITALRRKANRQAP